MFAGDGGDAIPARCQCDEQWVDVMPVVTVSRAACLPVAAACKDRKQPETDVCEFLFFCTRCWPSLLFVFKLRVFSCRGNSGPLPVGRCHASGHGLSCRMLGVQGSKTDVLAGNRCSRFASFCFFARAVGLRNESESFLTYHTDDRAQKTCWWISMRNCSRYH